MPMGRTELPDKEVLIAGVMAQNRELITRAEERLAARYGPIKDQSEVYQFIFTPYYEEEMGTWLVKKFISFSELIDIGRLTEIKLATNQQEEETGQKDGNGIRRTINIDPGYVGLSKLVLATTKDYDHRLYLGQGIFAEVTLRWSRKDKSFVPQEWTYRDYKTDLVIGFFNQVRQKFKEETGSS